MQSLANTIGKRKADRWTNKTDATVGMPLRCAMVLRTTWDQKHANRPIGSIRTTYISVGSVLVSLWSKTLHSPYRCVGTLKT